MALEKSVGSLYMAVLLDSMGAFMVMPLLPYLAQEFGANVIEVSLMQTAFCCFQTVGTIILGSLSDYMGRRKILLSTLSGCCLALLFCGLSQSVWQLIAARAFHGAFASTVSVCQTMIAERTPEEKRAEALARVMGVFSIGVLAGPVFGGLLHGPLGSAGVCYAACALTSFNVCWAFFQLEDVQAETKEHGQNESEVGVGPATKTDPIRQAMQMLWQRPVILVILCCTFMQTSILAVFMGTGAWYNLQEYGYKAWQNGLLMAVGGGTMLFCQFNITGPAVKRFSELGCIWISSGARCMSMLVYAFAPPSANPFDVVPYVCATVIFATMALVDPSLQTLLIQVAPAKSLGTVMGIGQALRSGGEAFGPAVAGYAYELDHRLPWLIAAVCAIIGGMLYVEAQPKHNDRTPSLLTKQAEAADAQKQKHLLQEPLLPA